MRLKLITLSILGAVWTVHSARATPVDFSQNLPVANYTASSSYQSSAQDAFNGGLWSAGTYSGNIQVDLGTIRQINEVSLVPFIVTSRGANNEIRTYDIYTKDKASDPWNLSLTSTVSSFFGVAQTFSFIQPMSTEYVEISVPASTSWVDFANVAVIGDIATAPETAVPEPDALPLFAGATGLLAWLLRRRAT